MEEGTGALTAGFEDELFCLIHDDAFRVCIPDSLQKTACPFCPN